MNHFSGFETYQFNFLKELYLGTSKKLLGETVRNWQPTQHPARQNLTGGYCTLTPLLANLHSQDLFTANSLDATGEMWLYLAYGPFSSLKEYATWMHSFCNSSDPLFYAIIDVTSNKAVGVASYLRIDQNNGVIEVGHLTYSPLLKRTRAATEAMFLMMQHAFELGYRRYEWKCNALNMPSRAAAERLGFTFEGIFRQAAVIKGHNRDTAWYSIIDKEWPALKLAFEIWLSEGNFDIDGKQKISLSSLTSAIKSSRTI